MVDRLYQLPKLLAATRRRELPLLILAALAAASVGAREIASTGRPWSATHGARSAPRPAAVPVPRYFSLWRERYLASAGGPDSLGLARGIFLGDDSAVTPEVRERFRQAGLSHLLAASGFNCWIVAAAFGILGALLLDLLSPCLSSGTYLLFRRHLTGSAQLWGAWLFWAWSDQSAPISRSALMITAKIVFEALRIAVPFHRVLLAGYLVALAILPRLWHSASFQLTFGCLFGLVAMPHLVDRFKPRRLPPLLDALWSYFFTSLGAVLGTIPTTILVFAQANFMSITTNWFAVPPVSFVVMPLGLAQILLLAPGLDLDRTQVGAALIHALAGANAQATIWLDAAIRLWLELIPGLRLEL